jgi:hypothetical protein
MSGKPAAPPRPGFQSRAGEGRISYGAMPYCDNVVVAWLMAPW